MNEYLWNELLKSIILKTVKSDFIYITLFTHSFKLIHICWAYNHMVRFPQSPGTNTHWMRVCAQGAQDGRGGEWGAAGRGTGEGKRRKKKRQDETKAGSRQLQPVRLGVSTDAGKAPEEEPLAQAGGSGKASRAWEAESAFVGQIKASQPSDRGQRQPGEGVWRQPGGAGFSQAGEGAVRPRGREWELEAGFRVIVHIIMAAVWCGEGHLGDLGGEKEGWK